MHTRTTRKTGGGQCKFNNNESQDNTNKRNNDTTTGTQVLGLDNSLNLGSTNDCKPKERDKTRSPTQMPSKTDKTTKVHQKNARRFLIVEENVELNTIAKSVDYSIAIHKVLQVQRSPRQQGYK